MLPGRPRTPPKASHYDVTAVAAVWKATSEQDWELCENNYAGIRSRRYVPGPFSTVTENSVEAFLDWYADRSEGWPAAS